MKKFKNNLSRSEMRTIYAGGTGGPVPISNSPECGDVCTASPSPGDGALGCPSGGLCPKCSGGKCVE